RDPPALCHIARALNDSLGNPGATVTYVAAGNAPADPAAGLRELAQAMDAGQVQLLVILGAKPVFTVAAALKFAKRLPKAGLSIAHTTHPDETSVLCHWNVPEAHPLESWGDARAFDGTVTVMQTLLA